MRYAGGMTLKDARADIDLTWIFDALDEFDSLLNPAPFKKQDAYSELRTSGVAEQTIATLYPLEPFAHAPGVAQLVRLPKFVDWAAYGTWRYYSGYLRSGLPSSLARRAADSLRTVENPAAGTFTYYASDPYDPARPPLMQLPAKRLFRTPGRLDRTRQRLVAEDFLALPLTLRLAADFPFRDYEDELTVEAEDFKKRLDTAHWEVERFLKLVRKHAQFVDLSKEG